MSFALDLRRAVSNIKEGTEKTIKGTLFSLSARIIKDTPVGNPSLWKNKPPKGYVGGALRANWQANINTTATNPLTIIDRGGDTTVASVLEKINALEIGDKFFLVNPLPYALPVEFGWSSQSPTGMVRVNVAQTQQVIDAL